MDTSTDNKPVAEAEPETPPAPEGPPPAAGEPEFEAAPVAPEPPPPEGEAEPEAPPAEPVCPRCGGKLVSPESLGWCMACGYCRSTEEDASKVALTAPPPVRPSRLGAVEAGQLVARLPPWTWALAGGLAVSVLLSLLGDSLTPEESRSRALWTTVQVAFGLAVLVVGQLWALALIAPHDERLGPRDAIIPFRLWVVTLKWVPVSRWPVCLGAWALALVVSAVLLVGGLEYWLPKPKKKAAAPAGVPVAHF